MLRDLALTVPRRIVHRDPRRVGQRQDDAAAHHRRLRARPTAARSESAARSSRTRAGTWRAPEQRHIGYVPQEGSLFPHLTVRRNVGFGLAARGGPLPVASTSCSSSSGSAGSATATRTSSRAGSSSGSRSLARSRCARALVLLDEPFSALDASMRASVRAEVRELVRAAGTTAVLVTHDQEEALSLADQVAVIRDGHIGQHGAPRELYSRPIDPELAAFLGEANLVRGVVAAASVRTDFGELALDDGKGAQTGGEALVLIRPEQVELCPPARTRGFPARWSRSSTHGHDAVMHVRLGTTTQPVVVVRVAGQVAQRPGGRVAVVVRGPVVAWPAGDGDDCAGVSGRFAARDRDAGVVLPAPGWNDRHRDHVLAGRGRRSDRVCALATVNFERPSPPVPSAAMQ